MTIPARAGSASTATHAEPLPFETPLGGDALARIDAGLERDLSPKAFKLHTALALRVEVGTEFGMDDMAAVSGLSAYQCRPLAAELVNARLLTRRRRVIDSHVVVRYALAVTA